MSVQVFDTVCDSCGHVRDRTEEEAAYEEALETLVDAARAVGRSQETVKHDLRAWWRWHTIADAAALDKDVVRLWWINKRERA